MVGTGGARPGAGRPKGSKNDNSWANMVRVAAHEQHVTGEPRLRALADVLWKAALDGDMAAIKEIGDRLDGKPKQTVDATHNTGQETLDALWKAIHGKSMVGPKKDG